MTSSVQYPRVSIGMPVFNGEKYIEAALNSNLQQSYDDFILYIADNASTDRTQEICNDYALMDKRIVYIRNANNFGAAANYSVCFKPSKSEYFRWSNSDDTIEPNLIEECIKFLDNNHDFVLAYGKTNIIDDNSNLLEKYDDCLNLNQDSAADRFEAFYQKVGLSNILYGLIRRDSLINTGLLGNYIASDINLIGELSLYGKFNEIQQYLFNRRMHPSASSWDRSDNEKQKDFWDPSKKHMMCCAYRQKYEYFKAVIKSPIKMDERIKLLFFLVRTLYWDKGKLFGEALNYAKLISNKT
ncbi:MAG: glycosyltransferase family 2 protein [Pseudomonadota bacterium]